jgi:hypothetical protein
MSLKDRYVVAVIRVSGVSSTRAQKPYTPSHTLQCVSTFACTKYLVLADFNLAGLSAILKPLNLIARQSFS